MLSLLRMLRFAWLSAPMTGVLCGCATTAPTQPAPLVAPSPAPKPAASEQVAPSSTADQGRIDPPVVQKVVRASFAKMQKCYEDGLERNPSLAGRVLTKFVIARDGSVSHAEEYAGKADLTNLASMPDKKSPPMPDRQVTSCVVAHYRTLHFPPPAGGSVTVVYPLSFAPGK